MMRILLVVMVRFRFPPGRGLTETAASVRVLSAAQSGLFSRCGQIRQNNPHEPVVTVVQGDTLPALFAGSHWAG